MNNFFLLIFFYILEKVFLEYETIELEYSDSYYYIPLNFPDIRNRLYFIFSTNLPLSFFPSYNCSKCTKLKIDETRFQNENKYVSIPYYFYNFTGKLLSGNYSTQKYLGEHNFVAFNNLSYATNYSGNGRYSLSYLNYNFNTSKKLFALKFTEEKAELHLGDYDHRRNMNELKTFNIVVEHKYENHTEAIIREGSNKNNLFENNLLIEEDDNITHEENITYEINKTVWYMSFPKLKIRKRKDEDVDNPMDEYKLTLDMSADRFYVPKKFFIQNVQNIFPKEAKCQVARGGYFTCQCDEDYKTKFGNFKFISENGVEFFVNVTDYMIYQSSISGSRCTVDIVINYDNDLFIGGTTVLNNYYSIFDIGNKTFSILPRENQNIKETGKYIFVFFVVLVLAFAILFGGYYFYNKYIINDPTGLAPQNNNDANNNANQIHGFHNQNNNQNNNGNLGNNGYYF